MQEKIKELAARRRAATTEEQRAEVAAEMDRLQRQDPEAYCRALENLIRETGKSALSDISKELGSVSASL